MMRVVGHNPIEKSNINCILIRATNWVGDVVMTIPALEAVRENFPASTLAVLARPWVIPLLENHPSVDQVLPLRKGKGYLSRMVGTIRVAGLIRRMRFDLAILFQNAFEAALLAYLGGVKFRVGYNTDGRGFLLSHAVIRDDEVLNLHQVEYYLSILRAMGWEAESRDPSLFVAEKDREAIQSLLSSERIEQNHFLLGLSPGAVFGPAKRWPADRFSTIGDWAAQRWGAKVVVVGSEGEKDICMAVSQSMKHIPLNLCGRTTLGEAMALIERCHFFVTNDSGLMHIAAALNVPMVGIFGSTDPAATGPRSRKVRIVQHPVDCAPCLKPECPTDYRCMLSIKPDEVWKEMESLRENLGT
ncbi:MAG: lipopolysaccharide heptosyltransferase II [Deltaproteobacteria bacterium]|nr:MAG: lipopolysaccharide heptosyltransferase II [Deltaproteobacteria bacterium]